MGCNESDDILAQGGQRDVLVARPCSRGKWHVRLLVPEMIPPSLLSLCSTHHIARNAHLARVQPCQVELLATKFAGLAKLSPNLLGMLCIPSLVTPAGGLVSRRLWIAPTWHHTSFSQDGATVWPVLPRISTVWPMLPDIATTTKQILQERNSLR